MKYEINVCRCWWFVTLLLSLFLLFCHFSSFFLLTFFLCPFLSLSLLFCHFSSFFLLTFFLCPFLSLSLLFCHFSSFFLLTFFLCPFLSLYHPLLLSISLLLTLPDPLSPFLSGSQSHFLTLNSFNLIHRSCVPVEVWHLRPSTCLTMSWCPLWKNISHQVC